MENKKFEKFFVKAGFGALFSLMLGILYKQGEKVSEALDDKYEKEYNVPKHSSIFKR